MTDKPQIRDKRRTPVTGRVANFVLREATFQPEFDDRVTSVSVVSSQETEKLWQPWISGDRIFPGGHIAEHEMSFEETARREALEEAGITLGALKFLRAIESDFYPDELTYMVILTGFVDEIVADPLEGERVVLTVEEFKAQHKALDFGPFSAACRRSPFLTVRRVNSSLQLP